MATTYEDVSVQQRAATQATQWPIFWSAIWVGALASLSAVLVFGLMGTAFGLHMISKDELRHLQFGMLVWSIIGSFLAFVIGGWVAGKIAGLLRSETAMLHGAIVWVLAVPLLLALATHGAATHLGGWYGGLAAPEPAVTALSMPTSSMAAVSNSDLEAQRAKEARNSALGAVTALLLGLVGSVIGGWMASGEPMTLTYFRTRNGAVPATTHGRF